MLLLPCYIETKSQRDQINKFAPLQLQTCKDNPLYLYSAVCIGQTGKVADSQVRVLEYTQRITIIEL